MKKLLLVPIVLLWLLYACDNTPQNTTMTLPPPPFIDRQINQLISNPYWIIIDSTGKITLAGKVVYLDSLQGKLEDSLKTLKKNGQPLPDTIMYKTEGTVMMGVRGAVKDAINDARAKIK